MKYYLLLIAFILSACGSRVSGQYNFPINIYTHDSNKKELSADCKLYSAETRLSFVTPQKINPDNVTPDQHYATLRNDPPYVQITDKVIRHLEDKGKLERKGLLSGL